MEISTILLLVILYTGLVYVVLLVERFIGVNRKVNTRINTITSGLESPWLKRKKSIREKAVTAVFDWFEGLSESISQSKIFSGQQTKKTAELLINAGWRSKNALFIFMSVRFALPVVLFLIALYLRYNVPYIAEMSERVHLIILSLPLIIGIMGPRVYLNKAVERYRNAIRKAIPDALDLMIICLEAGYSNDAALQRIATEFSEYNPEIAAEFQLTVTELKLVANRKEAWQKLIRRTDVDELKEMVSIIQQNDKFGTPLVQSLRAHMQAFRSQRLLKAKQKAGRLPNLLLLPLLIFFFPIIFVVVLAPAFITAYDTILKTF